MRYELDFIPDAPAVHYNAVGGLEDYESPDIRESFEGKNWEVLFGVGTFDRRMQMCHVNTRVRCLRIISQGDFAVTSSCAI